MAWKKNLWAVMFKGSLKDDKPMMLGSNWHHVARERAFYYGEPTRALLFQSRGAARSWCRAQMTKYRGREDCCGKWRFYPVRVVETVQRTK